MANPKKPPAPSRGLCLRGIESNLRGHGFVGEFAVAAVQFLVLVPVDRLTRERSRSDVLARMTERHFERGEVHGPEGHGVLPVARLLVAIAAGCDRDRP